MIRWIVSNQVKNNAGVAEGHSKQRGPHEQDGKELVLLVGHREEQGSWRHNKRGGMWWEVWKKM